jgi:dolichol-phosphate mannosyltransferase
MALKAITTEHEREIQVNTKIAVIMPVYNEAASIEKTLEEINNKIMAFFPSTRIMIFEDGSKDNTKELLSSLSTSIPRMEVHMSPERKGYPVAVRNAFANVDESEFPYVLFLDSDGQYDPDDFRRLFNVMSIESPDIVMGRRMNRAEPFYRVVLSSGLKILERLLFKARCKDVTSAFRLMRTSVAKSISFKVKYSSFNFWLEFTARAIEEGCSIREVPVKYRKREGESNVYKLSKMPKVVWSELLALVRTWWEYKKSKIMKSNLFHIW